MEEVVAVFVVVVVVGFVAEVEVAMPTEAALPLGKRERC